MTYDCAGAAHSNTSTTERNRSLRACKAKRLCMSWSRSAEDMRGSTRVVSAVCTSVSSTLLTPTSSEVMVVLLRRIIFASPNACVSATFNDSRLRLEESARAHARSNAPHPSVREVSEVLAASARSPCMPTSCRVIFKRVSVHSDASSQMPGEICSVVWFGALKVRWSERSDFDVERTRSDEFTSRE